ncbi:MAG: hypothetical protein L0Y72_17435 [Gemmataceae bacterium]|nr:hypothetical protein [Gemmataceae bacterium]
MNALRIRRKLESETLHLPELKALIGKNVEIIVLDESMPAIVPGTGDWDDAMQAVAELENYDFDAFHKQREYDLQHAKDHLP